MNKEIIEKYIQFAIENGYDGGDRYEINSISSRQYGRSINEYQIVFFNNMKNELDKCYSVFESKALITSKEFIEAIVNGINYKGLRNGNPVFMVTLNDITKFQAIAIRDGELEQFITNLLNLGTENKK